jgi:arylsulfatase A-like enzyme
VLAWLGLGCGAPPPPFALLLTVDTLRFDSLAAYGNPLELAPTLDALARESVVFEYCYAPASFTLPSITALLTSRDPQTVGVTSNRAVLPRNVPTLAGSLRRAGWRTAAVVSNDMLREEAGLHVGFDRYDAQMLETEAVRGLAERTAPGTTRAALALVDELLDADERVPIFLWVHYQDAHGPYTPPEAYRERYLEDLRVRRQARLEVGRSDRGLGKIPHYQYIEGHDSVAWYLAGYFGEVRFLDDHVRELFQGLRERGLWEHAAIVFAADHGEGLGELGYWFAHGEYLSDPLVRVPCFLRLPGLPPQRRRGPASLLDLAPTLLSYLGLEAPEGASGVDLLDERVRPRERPIALATLEDSSVPRTGLVWRGWKYLTGPEWGGGREGLFRLGAEGRNHAQRNPRVLEAMRAELRAARERLGPAVPPIRQRLGERERRRLRSLGYLEDEGPAGGTR